MAPVCTPQFWAKVFVLFKTLVFPAETWAASDRGRAWAAFPPPPGWHREPPQPAAVLPRPQIPEAQSQRRRQAQLQVSGKEGRQKAPAADITKDWGGLQLTEKRPQPDCLRVCLCLQRLSSGNWHTTNCLSIIHAQTCLINHPRKKPPFPIHFLIRCTCNI